MGFWLYFTVGLFTVTGVIYVYKTKEKYKTLDSYLTARGTLSTGTATATVFASVMGAWILFGPAEAATWGGLTAFIGYASAQALSTVVFAFLGPKIRGKLPHASTLTEYVYHRFGSSMYILVLVISIFYMGTFLTAELTGIGLALQLTMGIPTWLGAAVIAIGVLVYTTYGGIRGTIFTDTLQTFIIIPFLIIVTLTTVSIAGGFINVANKVTEIDPALTGFVNIDAWEFSIALILAIVSVSIFNQGSWSRVYACKNDITVRNSFLFGGLLQLPVVAMTGFFGLIALATGVLEDPSIAMFEVVLALTPIWLIIVFIILVLALVMSSVDTYINAIAAVITVDLTRFFPNLDSYMYRIYARLVTALVCSAAILVASRMYSVLYLFLIADLVCAGAVFPMIYGLFSEKLTGCGATISSIGGIISGFAVFPDPLMTRGNLLLSFMIALLTSTTLALIFAALSKKTVDFDELAEKTYDIKI